MMKRLIMQRNHEMCDDIFYFGVLHISLRVLYTVGYTIDDHVVHCSYMGRDSKACPADSKYSLS